MPHNAFIQVDGYLVNGGRELPAFAEVRQHVNAVARVELQNAAVVAVEMLGEVPHACLGHVPLGRECARTNSPDEMAAAPHIAGACHRRGRRSAAPRGLSWLCNRLCRCRNDLRLECRLCGSGGCLRLLGRLCRCGSGCSRCCGGRRLLWRRRSDIRGRRATSKCSNRQQYRCYDKCYCLHDSSSLV